MRRAGCQLTAFSDAHWGNNPDNGRSTVAYLRVMSKNPVRFNTWMQSLTAISAMEVKMLASVLGMKGVVFCSTME